MSLESRIDRKLSRIFDSLPMDEDFKNKIKLMDSKDNIEFECFDKKVSLTDFPSDVYLPVFYFYNKYKKLADEISINLTLESLEYFLNCSKVLIREDKGGCLGGIFIENVDNSGKEIIYQVCHGNIDGQEAFSVKVFGFGLVYEKVAKKLEKYLIQDKEKDFKIGLIRTTQFGLDVGWFSVPRPEVNIELNYGKEFSNVHYPVILNKLKTINKGLYLFESEPGTGKSFLIKHLASQIDNRKFIYLAENIIASGLDNPSLIDLLIENKNCVLIIEDAEKFIVSREQDSQSLVSNILNITDGILSDLLGFSLIITHNMKNVGDIDAALTRTGRLQYQYKFDRLNIEDSQKKIDSLGFSYKVSKPMTLAEIYNVQEQLGKVAQKEERVIGFR